MDLDFVWNPAHSNISINLRIQNDNLNPVIWIHHLKWNARFQTLSKGFHLYAW